MTESVDHSAPGSPVDSPAPAAGSVGRSSRVATRPAGRRIVLAAILILALALRIWNIDWDLGQHQHPDERHWNIVSSEIAAADGVSGYFDSAASPLNPYNINKSWVYGTSPLLVNKAFSSWLVDGVREPSFPANATVGAMETLGVTLTNDVGDPTFDNGYNSHVPGRFLSAVADTFTVLAVYLLSRRLFGRPTALLAAGLQATVALHIQYSHFFGSETWAALFVTAAMIGAVGLARSPRRGTAIALAAIALGLAIATKLTAAAAAPVVAFAPFLGLLGGGRPKGFGNRVRHFWPALESSLATGLISLLTFRVAQPYAFAGRWSWRFDPRYLDDLRALANLADGAEFPPNLQWINRTPLVYPLTQLFRWGMGPFLTLAVGIGLAVTVWKLRNRSERVASLAPVVPLMLVAIMLLLVGRQPNPSLRYMLPIYPTLVMFGAAGIMWLWHRRNGAWRVGAVAVAVLAGLWGIAFTNGIYGEPHTRVAASEWMVENMDPGSVISYQVWDDGLPLNLLTTVGHTIRSEQFEPFNADSTAKVDVLIDGLDRVDYVVESSNRVYDSVSRFPARYPSTIAYYDALFEEQLGFELVAEFKNHPGLFGLEIDDSTAEEAFSVYDHPPVTIWKKTDAYSRDLARSVLDPDRAQSGVYAPPGQANENAAMLRPDAYQAQQGGGTFSEVFGAGSGFTSSPSWLWWLIALQVASFAALPWTTWVFKRLFGAGYGLSKPLGLFAVAIPVWLTVAWGVADMSRALVVFWFAAVIVAGVIIARVRGASMIRLARDHWSAWLAAELVFLVVFGVMVWMRSTNPDLWHPWRGGEKPMELAHLTAVTKSTTLPPFDPWFAGGSLNYFYFGFFVLAVPIRLLQILPEVGFNLGISTYAAFTAVIAFTTVASLLAATARRNSPMVRSRTPIIGGVFGVVVLMVAGNFASLRQRFDQFTATRANGEIGWTAFFTGDGLVAFDWWAPSRVNAGTFDITEFPAWSFLFADLHPHVMGMVPLGLVVATALTYVRSAVADDRLRTMVLAAGLGVTTGVTRMLNTWDFPTVILIAGGTIVAARWATQSTRRSRLTAVGRDLLLFGVVHSVFVAPFVSNMRVYDSGLTRSPYPTPLDGYITQFAFPTLVIAVYLAFRVGAVNPLAGRSSQERLSMLFFAGGALSLLLTVLLIAAPDERPHVFAIAGALVVLALFVAALEISRRNLAQGFAAALAALGFGIILGVEVVAIANDIERLNTVFKFWYQAWHVLALVSAFAAVDVARQLSHERIAVRSTAAAPVGARSPQSPPWARPAQLGWIGGVSILVLMGLTFPLFALGPRLGDRFPGTEERDERSLNGLAYLEGNPVVAPEGIEVPIGQDLAQIRWLRENAVGSPTLVEAVGGGYQWPGRFAITTGLPAVVGWHHHQNQQRRDFEAAVGQRRIDTENFWRIADPVNIAAFLRRYDVTYVVIGTEEMNRSVPEMRALLDNAAYLDPVWSAGELRIFEVDKWAIRGADRSAELNPLVYTGSKAVESAASD